MIIVCTIMISLSFSLSPSLLQDVICLFVHYFVYARFSIYVCFFVVSVCVCVCVCVCSLWRLKGVCSRNLRRTTCFRCQTAVSHSRTRTCKHTHTHTHACMLV